MNEVPKCKVIDDVDLSDKVVELGDTPYRVSIVPKDDMYLNILPIATFASYGLAKHYAEHLALCDQYNCIYIDFVVRGNVSRGFRGLVRRVLRI